MGGKSSTPCDTGGYAHCERVEHAESCQAGDGFWCTCQKGFSPQGTNQSATCIDIDECAQGLDNCKQKGGDCVNTPGSFTCGCGLYRQEKDGVCIDINECATNRGDCDENSDCINVDGAEQLCKCHKGWTGNGDKPGVACRDINECNENPAICPSNAVCTNLPGSYKCECGPGFEPDSSGSGCVTEDFCGTGKNDCDTVFATCSLVPGSFNCTAPDCLGGSAALVGNEDLACTTLGLTCGCLYKRFIKKREENEEDLLAEQDIGEGYNYGATQGYYA
ncbi:microneme protein 7, putative [Eimeria praecox]|uniref:Microneme protein 7, putative n=1 Tax=Eimeria praecox TaxID=51316 RepID=U6G6G1_9EIME|nr:microneme protein 7, putative [Eimeria praecox]